MSWYTTGTVNLTKGSKTVTGVGTKWANSLSGVSTGRMLILPTTATVEIYEIESIQSDTQLTLAENYSGATVTNKTYKIPTSPSVSIEQFSLEIASSLAYHQKQLDGWQNILTGTGDVTLTAPNGQKVTIKSQKMLADLIDNAVKKSGDTMTGNLSVKDKISILNKDNCGLILHAQDNTNNFLFLFVKDGKSDHKMAYNQSRNSIEFRELDDVKINGKPILKTGDAMGLFGNLAETNINKLNGLSEGFYFQNANKLATSQNGYPINEAGDLKVTQNGAEGKEGCCQIYTTYRNVRQFIRNYRPVLKTWEEWTEQITTRNSTVDSNGFYKKASPILRLYGTEHIENIEGFKKSGYGLVNDLAKGVTAKRIDVGYYEIYGSLGFARDGWYITLPEDANGNKKFFAEYTVDENNVIKVKTYTKKWNTELCEVTAGDPIDITEGRWIDVRLEMPIIEDIESSIDDTEIVELTTTDKN